ncbi:MAG: 16S rRNA (cytosine(1402)-N(4))-methyltransferase RsmH [Muribaculaceae bacterium]|nr:16S rRNA (cytosine(1402)-N(4))-methyltransferase RsmH [Muribaculaceae bacterium]
MSETVYHIPALLPQCLDALDIHPGGVYVDCTFGGGGHSRAILERLDAAQGGHLYGFDQDRDALANAPRDPRFTMVLSNFRYLVNFMRYYNVESVDGVLADLGVSFHHFDDAGRGFSFRWPEGPLDMRMNRNARRTAADILNTASEEELTRILRLYGEVQNAPRMARTIVAARAKAPLATAGDLLEAIAPLISPRKEKKELAQVFQALRICVNDEIAALRELLAAALTVLRPGGRLAVITYHSLEDRLVKNFMKTGNMDGRAEQDFYGRSLAPMRMLTSKAIVADEAEVERNPRSRSAKLRVAVKL